MNEIVRNGKEDGARRTVIRWHLHPEVMIKIAIFNQKGGASKSAATVNIAGCMAKDFNKKVLVMDCDAQQNSSLQLLNRRVENTIVRILKNECQLMDCIYPVEIEWKRKLTRIPVDVLCSGMDIDVLGPEEPKAYKNITDVLENEYDYCLIDCPPQKMATALTSLVACEHVLVPVWTETDESIQGWDMVLDLISTIKNQRLNDIIDILGIVITRTRKSTRDLDRQLAEAYKAAFGNTLFDSYVRDLQDINDAYMMRKPVCYYKSNGNASKDYYNVTKELIERCEAKKRKVGK